MSTKACLSFPLIVTNDLCHVCSVHFLTELVLMISDHLWPGEYWHSSINIQHYTRVALLWLTCTRGVLCWKCPGGRSACG